MTAICELCEFCKFWSPQRIQGKGPDVSGVGYCRRSFPRISEYLVAKLFGEGLRDAELSIRSSFWPATSKEDSCGEFTEREV
jgi:hypothetical protein